MTTSFTDVGTSTPLLVPAGYKWHLTLTGTWVATILLQVQEGNGWKTLVAFGANTDQTFETSKRSQANTYRLQCISFTSGTAIYTTALSTAPQLLAPLLDALGVEQLGVDTNGVRAVIAIVSSLLRLTGIEDGLTAHAGGTKAAALVLDATKCIHRISVCATNADSVLLPPAVVGEVHIVINSGAAALQVFGAGTDTINDVASATGVSQATLKQAIYICVSAGKWYGNLSA